MCEMKGLDGSNLRRIEYLAALVCAGQRRGAGNASKRRHAYRGTKDQISDATLTTKVKAAMLTDHVTKKYTIHVDSNHGTVTLLVDSSTTAAHSQRVVARS